MKFWNCNKTLLSDLADFSSTWTGYSAKYFEDCSQSNNASVVLIDKSLRDAKTDQNWYGTTDAKSARYCINTISSTTYSASESDPATLF